MVIAGPLTRIGMDSAGTLQEVVAFMELIADVRRRCGRRFTLLLVHHENKGGAVSGAWEGAGDTLLHVQAAGPGQTVVHIQKARWASEYHGKTLRLSWGAGETFQVDGDRDYVTEIEQEARVWRTQDEIRKLIGAGKEHVREALEDESRFEMATGEAARKLGRSSTAKLYRTRLTPESTSVHLANSGVGNGNSTTPPTLKGRGSWSQ